MQANLAALREGRKKPFEQQQSDCSAQCTDDVTRRPQYRKERRARAGVSFHKKALVPREQAAQKLAYLIVKQTALPLLL